MESIAPSAATPPPAEKAAQYEAQHVQAVYETIAPHFAATRYAPWPRVDEFLRELPAHSLVADVGCGNGKYLLVASRGENAPFCVGVDLCEGLARIAGRAVAEGRRCDVGVGDVVRLPFRDEVFDAAVNIAVVHHLASRERRIAAWRESVRVLRVGGQLLAYVWALERPSVPKARRGNQVRMMSRRFESQDVFVPWHMRRKKEGAQSEKVLGGTEEILKRFYHVYREGELEEELACVAGAEIVQRYYDHQNWCAVVRRAS